MRRRAFRLGLAALALAGLAGAAAPSVAQEEEGRPVPRFVSLKSGEVNLRTGPGTRYPIDWVYQRAGYPVEIVAQFDIWRQIRDADGTIGWVHQSLLSPKRTALVTGGVRTIRQEPSGSSPGVVLAEPGVVVELNSCAGDWCAVAARGYDGFLQRAELWGIYPDETIN